MLVARGVEKRAQFTVAQGEIFAKEFFIPA
jgi:hypothetical protein